MSQFITAIYIEGKINNHRIVAPPLGRLSVEFNAFCMKEVSNEKTKKILSMKIISMKIVRMKIISMEEMISLPQQISSFFRLHSNK